MLARDHPIGRVRRQPRKIGPTLPESWWRRLGVPLNPKTNGGSSFLITSVVWGFLLVILSDPFKDFLHPFPGFLPSFFVGLAPGGIFTRAHETVTGSFVSSRFVLLASFLHQLS